MRPPEYTPQTVQELRQTPDGSYKIGDLIYEVDSAGFLTKGGEITKIQASGDAIHVTTLSTLAHGTPIQTSRLFDDRFPASWRVVDSRLGTATLRTSKSFLPSPDLRAARAAKVTAIQEFFRDALGETPPEENITPEAGNISHFRAPDGQLHPDNSDLMHMDLILKKWLGMV